MNWRAKRPLDGAAAAAGGAAAATMGAAAAGGQAPRGAGAKGAKAAKQHNVAAAPELQTAVVSLQKLALKTAADQREMSNTVFEFWILPYLAPPVTAGLEAGLAHHETVRSIGKGHNQGPPHTHVAAGFVESIHETLTAEDQYEGPAKQVLGELMQLMSTNQGMQITNEIFRVFRLKETYKPDGTADADRKVKLQYNMNLQPDLRTTIQLSTPKGQEIPAVPFSIDMRALQAAINLALTKHQGLRPVGPGPRTELERAVERQLRNLQRQ